MNGRRTIGIGVVAASLVAAWFATSGAARMRPAEPVLHVGDSVRVAGTSTRCAVARRSGQVMVECLPTRPAAGAYATVAGDARVLVVRFRSPHVAQTVFHARQHSTPVLCR